MVEQLLKMSLTASIVILVVVLLRQLLKRFPKRYVYYLWMVVWFRLLCPVSIGSRLSIFNIKRAADHASEAQIAAAPTVSAGGGAAEAEVMRRRAVAMAYRRIAATPEVHSSPEVHSAAAKVDPHTIMLWIWVAVALAILGYAVFNALRLKFRLRDAKEVDRRIYMSPLVESPFVMGILRPAIYIPTDLGEDESEYLIEHERTHIRRGDLIFKMFAVVAVAGHWFNPLVWISFILFCRDMEMGCDEIVLERLGVGIRKDYSLSLVSMAKRNDDRSYVVMPVAFVKGPAGISEVKMRIDNILRFKKNSAWTTAVAGVTILGVGLTCGFNAYADETEESQPVEETVVETEASVSDSQIAEDTFSETEAAPAEDQIVEDAEAETDDALAASMARYMLLRSEYETQDYSIIDQYDYCIDDMSVIEDEDIRAVAEDYYSRGFVIFNPERMRMEGSFPGYELYMFNGFNASSVDGYYEVYKMDDILFEDYYIENSMWDLSSADITDDGNIITITLHFEDYNEVTDYSAMFDRSTGIAEIFTDSRIVDSDIVEDDNVVTDDITFASEATYFDDMSVIENDNLRAVAEEYQANGYSDFTMDIQDYGAIYLHDGSHYEGFSATYCGDSFYTFCYVLQMDEALYNHLGDGYAQSGSTVEDDGTVITYTNSYEGGCWQFSYNRDTGVGIESCYIFF